MSFFDDDLTEQDMEFLQAWEKMGKSESSDSEYAKENADAVPEFEGGADTESNDDQNIDPDAEGDELDDELSEDSDAGGVEGESDTMDLDGTAEKEGDHLESGESDSEIQDGESELEYDDLEELPAPEGLDDEGLTEDDFPPDDLGDAEVENVENDEDYDFSQIEEDDGEGERGNSDEARESDEPIDTESEIPEHDSDSDEIDMDIEASEVEQKEEPSGDPTPEADAEHEAPEDFDAQQELEDHLTENPEAEPEQKADKADEIPEGAQQPQEGQENAFEGVPAAGEACTNHCEDNPTDDHDGECPHCKGRIEREKELWGVIATDMNDTDIYPGDKLLVTIPMAFTVVDAILTANVPNQAVDPIRVAEATDGHVDPTICWLSGRVSQFTGWHMQGAGNSIWTFPVGKRIGFVTKVGEISGHDSHGSNADEGDQLDIDDMLRDIEQKATEESEKEAEESYEEEDTDEVEGEADPEDDESDSDEAEDSSEDEADGDSDEDRKRKRSGIPQHQRARFVNIEQRIAKKIEDTFGSTCEKFEFQEITGKGDEYIAGRVKVVSRGMTFYFDISMRRYDESQDGPIEAQDDDDESEAA